MVLFTNKYAVWFFKSNEIYRMKKIADFLDVLSSILFNLLIERER